MWSTLLTSFWKELRGSKELSTKKVEEDYYFKGDMPWHRACALDSHLHIDTRVLYIGFRTHTRLHTCVPDFRS